ncbi:serine carboxypeptidase [Purpureocillium lavendulum]|uniref:Carboxypeptidase n=1 Tax=Purpureocillium lavendulum TaxID=1247861 RepID=A0AB34G345_9HYPO|nr:serine carboxypeptidase [Purpureocillium lavendulum]
MSAAVETPTPKVVTREEWLDARRALLVKEKELTRANDALSAERRSLPMVEVTKPYSFKSATKSDLKLEDLFNGKDQLIVYHFMFSPDSDSGCRGCTHIGECLPDVRHLRFKNTNLVCVSRASPDKLDRYKALAGWTFPWYSSEGSDFNYDFWATADETRDDALLNFRSKKETDALGKGGWYNGDVPGFSVFYKKGGKIFHTYSTFARGGDKLLPTLGLLDMTPLGRQLGQWGPAEFKMKHEYDTEESKSEGEQLRQFLKAKHEPKSQDKHSDRNHAHIIQERTNKGHQFLTNKTQPFAVDGTKIPEVSFDAGESYAGLLPISNKTDEQNNLYFWFFPSANADNEKKKEIVIWLNGGPGCSSLLGLVQENGPFLWQEGMPAPVKNPWSWNLLTNVVWIEQPVTVGFSKGTSTVKNENDVARQFMGFWRNFIDTFGMQGYKVYVVAESYGGMYGPYISSNMLDANDKTYYDLRGMMIYDGLMFSTLVQQYAPTENFVDQNYGLMPLDDSIMSYIHNVSQSCGYTDYLAQYMTFPPPAPPEQLPWTEPTSDGGRQVKEECVTLWDEAYYGMIGGPNPCFNVYNIPDHCPFLVDPLVDNIPYFNRADVKAAIHAPLDITWEECVDTVFPDGDDSPYPAWYELPNVINKTQNVIIAQGGMDYILPATGALLGIQTMTWGGKQGFQSRPTDPFYVPHYYDGPYGQPNSYGQAVPAGHGVVGTTHHERGLTFVVTQTAGHEGPGYAPAAALRQLEKLLGRVHSLSDVQPFTIPELTNITQASKPLGKGTFVVPCFGHGC